MGTDAAIEKQVCDYAETHRIACMRLFATCFAFLPRTSRRAVRRGNARSIRPAFYVPRGWSLTSTN